jgi:hypothetical protein
MKTAGNVLFDNFFLSFLSVRYPQVSILVSRRLSSLASSHQKQYMNIYGSTVNEKRKREKKLGNKAKANTWSQECVAQSISAYPDVY